MPLNLHRSSDGADPLAALVSHLDDNIAGLALRQPALANLSRRADCRLHSSIEIVELGALVIAHGLCAV